MDLIKKEERVSVLIRLFGDETINQYQRCVSTINRDIIQLSETPDFQDFNDIEGFIRKDKLAHSPQKGDQLQFSEQLSQEPSSPQRKPKDLPEMLQKEKSQLISVDYVYLENEPAELIVQNLALDLKKHNCIISVGRSEALTVKGGMIIGLLKRAFDEGFQVQISCAVIGNKVQPLIEGNKDIKRFEEGVGIFYSLDYFNPRKSKEPLVVTTIILEKQGEKSFLQFADISQFNKSVENLGLVLTNSEEFTEIPAKDKLVQVLSKSICSAGKVVVIGNINPTIPYYSQTKNTLSFLDNIYKNRHKSKTLYTQLLLRQIERLQRNNTVVARNHEELGTQINIIKEEKSKADEDIKMYQTMLLDLQQKQMMPRDEQEIVNLTQQLNSLREVDLIKKTEIYELKQKCQDLEKMLQEEKEKTRGFEKELEIEKYYREEKDRKYEDLSKNVNLINGKLHEAEAMVKVQKSFIESLPSHITVPKNINREMNDIAISPFKDTDNKENQMNLQEQLAQVQSELDSVKVELRISNEKIQQLEKAENPIENSKDMEYYNLVKGAWSFTEAVQKELMTIIENLRTLMDVRVKNAAAKEYALRLRLQKIHTNHTEFLKEYQQKIKDKEELASEHSKLEKEHIELQGKYDALKAEIKDEVQKFKVDAKDKLKNYKGELQNYKKENEELKVKLQESEAAIKQLKERNAHIVDEMKDLTHRYDKSKSDFIKNLNIEKEEMKEQFNKEKKRFEEEIAALKMLREPLANPRRKANA
ncbi:unnamed protein product [Blepharisma stoltei]|uniref:Uncharacterized protein n=1 Tax=Blepharisma stoltei TaxID=1481888 RepID=A0AAU9JW26_9CILI|nr:unnamed protein product [Blepharisma stoltei]